MNSYFEQRCEKLGISTEDASFYGLHEDPHGNIQIRIFHPDGQPVTYIPKDKHIKKTAKTQKGNGVVSDITVDVYRQPLHILRYTPDNLERINEQRKRECEAKGEEFKPAGKYKFQAKIETGMWVDASYTPVSWGAYNTRKTGGTIYFTEGQLKAIAMAARGYECVAFSGISVFRIDPKMRAYLQAHQPDHVVIVYDNDGRQLSKKQGGTVVSTNRLTNFQKSATKFAGQLFDLIKLEGLSTKVWFSPVAEGQPAKGLDDLFEHYGDDKTCEALDAIIKGKGKSTGLFSPMRLSVSSYKNKLLDWYGTRTHVHTYARYGGEIGENPFTFAGAIYQRVSTGGTDLFSPTGDRFRLVKVDKSGKVRKCDPFEAEVDATEIKVTKYLTEAEAALDAIIQDNDRLCIDAPTGVGKTAFWIGYQKGSKFVPGFARRTGQRVVIVVPTVLQANQLKKYPGVASIYGSVSVDMRTAANIAEVVVCTYETLHWVPDIERRILVIDEAHNLVNSYGGVDELGKAVGKEFRAKPLRNMLRISKQAKKTIFISGTPSHALCRELGCKFVKVKRTINTQVHIRHIEAATSSNTELSVQAMAEMRKVNWAEGKVHFVFWNSTQQLEELRKHLISNKLLKAHEIEIITRPHVDGGEYHSYNDIVSTGVIRGKKLILSSCIIAEGVNILNENVGNVYMVNTRCIDSFRQYIARFRRMDRINVISIRPPETALPRIFLKQSHKRIEELKEEAKIQAMAINNQIDEHASEFMDDELALGFHNLYEEFNDQQRQVFTLTCNADGRAEVDMLRIMAAERERMTRYMNNAYFYDRLSKYDGIQFEADQPGSDDQQTEELREGMKVTAKEMRAIRKASIQACADMLLSQPSVVIMAYLLYCERSKNRHALKAIYNRVPDLLIKEAEQARTYKMAKDFIETYEDAFKHRHLQPIINAFMRMHGAGIDADTIREYIQDFNPERFKRVWQQFSAFIDQHMYEDSYLRRHMEPVHKAEVKARIRISKKVAEYSALTGTQLIQVMKDALKYKRPYLKEERKNEKVDFPRYTVKTELVNSTDFSAEQARTILHSMFDVSEVKYCTFTEFQIHGQYGIDTVPDLMRRSKPKIMEHMREWYKIR